MCIWDVWTCIWVSGLVFRVSGTVFGMPVLVFLVSSHHPVVCVLAAGAFFFLKMTPLGFLNTYIVNLVDFHQFEGPLVKNSKYGQSTQMTMPARRASKFSAKRRAVSPEMFFQSLISQAIPGFCEPWSECQPEESRPPEGRPEDSSICICILLKGLPTERDMKSQLSSLSRNW